MEKYLALLILLSPGFIASHVAVMLGVQVSRKGEIDAVMRYFSYSMFSLLMMLALAFSTGFLHPSMTWQDFAGESLSIMQTAKLLSLSATSGVLSGALWAMFLSRRVAWMLNRINSLTGHEHQFIGGSILNRLFCDGREHFVIIRKGEVVEAVGFIYAASDPNDARDEIAVTEYPEYRAELEKARQTGMQSPLKNVRQTYMDMTNGVTITETDFPAEWLPGGSEAVSASADAPEPVGDGVDASV